MAEFTGGGGGSIDPHSSTHEAGGSDEVSVATGLLVDDAVTAAKIASGAVGSTQVDLTDTYTWTSEHEFRRPTQTAAKQRLNTFINDDSGNSVGWYLDDTGVIRLEQGGSNIIFEFDPSDTNRPETQAVMEFGVGSVHEDWIDYGTGRDIRTEYQSGDDVWAIRDQTNGLDRAEVDRTTGNLTIEGTLTEGANL